MKTFIEFLIENNKLPYYSSDSFHSKEHHNEHMLLNNLSEYRKPFETTLDATGNYMNAHNAGITEVINIPTPKPYWNKGSLVTPEHQVTQLFKLNPRVIAVTPELVKHINTKA
jgi:hypothetical protein